MSREPAGVANLRRLHVALVVGSLLAQSLFARAAPEVDPPPMTGHLTILGPWTSRFRSTAVLLDRDSVDGFFFDTSALAPGTRVRAEVIHDPACLDGSACGDYDLDLNFHGRTVVGPVNARQWLGGCSASSSAPSVECEVRCEADGTVALTGEVTGKRGAEIDVRVTIIEEPDPPYCLTR